MAHGRSAGSVGGHFVTHSGIRPLGALTMENARTREQVGTDGRHGVCRKPSQAKGRLARGMTMFLFGLVIIPRDTELHACPARGLTSRRFSFPGVLVRSFTRWPTRAGAAGITACDLHDLVFILLIKGRGGGEANETT